MGKESKALIEMYAKQTGKPAEEVAADIAKMYGYQKPDVPIPTAEEGKISPIMEAILAAKKAELEMGRAGAEEVSPTIKMAMEMMIMMPLMNKLSGQGQDSGRENINELLAKNDEKWERRNAQEKSDRRFEELQKTNERLERLFLEGGAKKDDPILDELKEQRKELAAEREKRHDEAIAAKDDKIASLKDYIDDSLATVVQNQPTPKDPSEAFFEFMDKMDKFDNTVKRRGKALGMTDEQIDKELKAATPMKQQMLNDAVELLKRLIDTWGGKKPEATEQPEIAEVATTTCGNCGKPSTNGTDWCDACRIQYSNDVVAAQQKAQAEAEAMKRPEKPPEKPIEVQETEQPTTESTVQ